MSGEPAMAAGRPPAARSPLLQAALHSLLLAAVALFFLNLNLYGTATASRRFSQDLVYAWFGNEAWLYPRPAASSGHSPGAPPRAVVIIIDEHALAMRGARWPVPVEFHAQFLSELEVLQPRGILLDFLLIDPASHQDTCDLLRVGAQLRRDRIPLYLAIAARDDLKPMDAAGCHDPQGALIRTTDVFTPVSVARQVDGSDFVSRRYPFEQRLDATAAPGSGIPSAAVHMYCDTERSPAACLKRLDGGPTFDAGFDLAWSPNGDPFNQRWSQAACLERTSPFRAILNQPALPRESACPPVPTLFAGALLSPEEDPSLGLDNDALFRIAGGAFLLVGGNFRGTGDLVTTPMHTLLPGVYYHAVALENLLAFHGQPKVRKDYRSPRLAFYGYDLLVLWVLAAIFQWRQSRLQQLHATDRGAFALSAEARAWLAPVLARWPTPVWIVVVSVLLLLLATFKSLQLIAVLLSVIGLVVIELRVAPKTDIRVRAQALTLYLTAMGLSLTIIALAIFVGYRWLRLPPGDWLGYLSFSAFGYFLAHAAIMDFGRKVDQLYIERCAKGGAS